METLLDPKRAPMPAAPMKYRENGEIAWGEMWDTFCVLALDGGPPHRGELLGPPANPDTSHENYQLAIAEIIRGIREVSGLLAVEARPGWIAITCPSVAMAHWLAQAIVAENVVAQQDGPCLLLPVGDTYTVKGEIKNVITAVAKTTYYWADHVPTEVKQTLHWQMKVQGLQRQLGDWWKRVRGQ